MVELTVRSQLCVRMPDHFALLRRLAVASALGIVLSGCAAGDGDAAIGTPGARVEGLVSLPSTETQPAPVAQPQLNNARPIAAGGMAPPPELAAYMPSPSDAVAQPPPMAVDAEAALLREVMAREVPREVHLPATRRQALIALGQRMAAEDHLFIRRPELVLIVDRAPMAQLLAMTLARPDGDWETLGTARVSTGKPGRREHFKTPVGVLLNDGSEIGYRAQGTYNQNHIRGLGVKGMRVWDFGWQTTDDWRTPGATMEVRVEMHATDPSVLEERLGRADSEGCIRLPDAINRFLDRHGIIDADIERLGETDAGYRGLLSPELQPTPLAGDAVIVVDSSEPWAKPYPPQTNVALSD